MRGSFRGDRPLTRPRCFASRPPQERASLVSLPQGEREETPSLTRRPAPPKTTGKAMEERMFKDLFSLNGRVALVTGGSRGIGKMIAAGFLAQGAAKVYITARKAGPCEATAKELSAAYDGECIALPIDISTLAGIDLLAAEIRKREPKLDILVNNAGAAWGAEFDEFPE